MAETVSCLRVRSQDVSSGDSVAALRMTGLLIVQLKLTGVYPSGAFGRARVTARWIFAEAALLPQRVSAWMHVVPGVLTNDT